MSEGFDEQKGSLDFPRLGARIWTLDNGLELLVREDSSAPVASLQAWCRSGSIHEGEWLGAGLSHFLEHMLFKGTESREGIEIARTVQAAGGYINAYTSFDRTVYWIDSPAEGVPDCLDVLCDVVGHSTLPEDEFEKEREVIHREIAMGEDNPEQVLGKLLFRTAYTVHPCRHPVIGHPDLFGQLTRDDLERYYRSRYSPDKLFLVVVGDVDAEKIRETVEARLGRLARRPSPEPVLPDEPRQLGRRTESSEFPTDLLRMRFGWPAPDLAHPDAPALDVLGAVLGGGRSSRLARRVKDERQLAHSVSAYCYTSTFPGLFVVNADTETGKREEAEAAILGETALLRDEGVSPEELNKVKRMVLSSQFSTLTDMRGQASDLGMNWLHTRNPDFTRDYVRAVNELTTDQLREAAARHLPSDTFTSVELCPPGEARPAARRTHGTRGDDFRRLELDNGLTVLLLADHRVPFVHASGVFRGGLLAEESATNGTTRLLARLLTKDTAARSAEEVSNAIECVGGGISGSCGNNSFGVTTGTLRPDLGLAVELLGDALLSPALLDDTVSRERNFQLAGIKAERDRPFTVAMKRLRRELFGDHPYGLERSGSEESVASLEREQLAAHHHRLVKGGNGVVGVFGDLDLDRGEDLVRQAFSEKLRAGEREFTEGENRADNRSHPGMPETLGTSADLVHEKEQAVLLVGYRTAGLAHPDQPALEIIDEACSDMASRMFLRIREELGLAYSVGATRMLGLHSGFLLFYVSTAPEKLALVEEELLDEIHSIPESGLRPEEFERAKASWRGKEAIRLQETKELAEDAVVHELVGLGWDHYRKAPGRIRDLAPDEVQSVARSHIREDNQVVVRLTRE